MKKAAIIYGSTTGVTEDIARQIAKTLNIDSSSVFDAGKVKTDDILPFEVLILGSSTWGVGDLQDDWELFLPKLGKTDLSGKVIVIFGTGDSCSYPDTFCDAIGTIYQGLRNTGCNFYGAVSAEDYHFDDSSALVEGMFVGLPLDEVNEDEKTEKRIDNWLIQLKDECLN